MSSQGSEPKNSKWISIARLTSYCRLLTADRLCSLSQHMNSQPTYRAILDRKREVRRRRGERVKWVSVVDHGYSQVLIVDRQNDDDRMLIGIVVSILDAVGEKLLDGKKSQVHGLWGGLVRLKPAFRLRAGGRNRIAGIRHLYGQAISHDVLHSGWDGSDYKRLFHRAWTTRNVCSEFARRIFRTKRILLVQPQTCLHRNRS